MMKKLNKLKHTIKGEFLKSQKSSSPKLLKEQVNLCPDNEPLYHHFAPCLTDSQLAYAPNLGYTVDADNTVNNMNFMACNCPGESNCMCGYEEGNNFLDIYAQEYIYNDEDGSSCLDNSGQFQLQAEFYASVGSPSAGDVVYFPNPNEDAQNAGNNPCMKYLGSSTEQVMGVPGMWSTDFTGYFGTIENLGAVGCDNPICNPPLPVQHSCSPCDGCIEDPDGPFSSLEECQESGCSEDLEIFANSIGIVSGVSGMTAAEQYCTKCSTNSYSPPMDEKCGCCEKITPTELPPKDPPKDPVRDRMQKLAGLKK